jgi:SAGA-associated factor 29
MSLTRENVRLCEEIVAAVEGESDQDVNSLLGGLNILSGLRAASEAESHTPAPRGGPISKSRRDKPPKKDTTSVLSADDRDSIVADSPAASSPKVHIPPNPRLKLTTSSSRAGSVPAVREASVKIEDGSESGADAVKRKNLLPIPGSACRLSPISYPLIFAV